MTFSDDCWMYCIEGSSKEKYCTAKAVLRPVDEADLQTDIKAFIEAAKKYDITVEVDEKSEYHGPADMRLPMQWYFIKSF